MSSCDELDATEINGAETFDPGDGADATATVDTADDDFDFEVKTQ
jgi:hypothetical protein